MQEIFNWKQKDEILGFILPHFTYNTTGGNYSFFFQIPLYPDVVGHGYFKAKSPLETKEIACNPVIDTSIITLMNKTKQIKQSENKICSDNPISQTLKCTGASENPRQSITQCSTVSLQVIGKVGGSQP